MNRQRLGIEDQNRYACENDDDVEEYSGDGPGKAHRFKVSDNEEENRVGDEGYTHHN